MSSPGTIPGILLRFLRAVLPRDRREEVLADLEDAHRARIVRKGRRAARRHLYREAGSLLLWRLGWHPVPAGQRSSPRRVGKGGPGKGGPGPRRRSALGSDLLQDLRFGVRTLRRRPGFSLMAVLVLGVGIGAPATVFTLVNAIFFHRPAQVSDPDRLIRLYRSWAPGEGGGALANPDFTYYRQQASTLSGVAAYGGMQVVAYSAGERNDQLRLLFTSDNYFDVLGVVPAQGRGFLREENTVPGGAPVVVLSHAFWLRALGARRDLVGSTVRINDRPFRVVGIAPAGFTGISPVEAPADAWTPIAMYGAVTRASDMAWWERLPSLRERWLSVVGRLQPGVTFESAQGELTALSSALEYEGKDPEEGLLVARQFLFRPSQQATLVSLSRMLLIVVTFVLVIATSNVAVLLLSRATTRDREIGIRAGLGAGRGRIVRQLLAESLLLGSAGGVLGVGLAFALGGLAGGLLPLPFAMEFRPDARVLLASAALALSTAVLAGLAPALHAARMDVGTMLRGSRFGVSRGFLRNALVTGQIALSVVLVAGAFLFARSFWAARSQDVGFATDHRLVIQVNLRNQGYTPVQGRVFLARALERIGGLPGVENVTTARQIPFQGDWTTSFDAPPGAQPNDADGQILTGMNVVGPDYFQVAGIPIERGRSLGPEDSEGSPLAVVINQRLAEQIWPDQDPLGRTLPLSPDHHALVVGVARTATYYALGEEPFPQVYAYLFQAYQPIVHFVVNTEGPPAALTSPVEQALRDIDPALAFGWVTTMASVLEDQTSRYEVSAVLVSLFSVLALLLAASGLYGVVSFAVARHTREIGVRMALGADRSTVAGEVLRSAARLGAVGLGLGLLGSVALRHLARSLLYEVEPNQVWPLLAASTVMALVTALAALAPARRATRVDPMEAIRTE